MASWRQALDEFFRRRGESPHRSPNEELVRHNMEAGAFIDQVVIPAFEQVADALKEYGREVLLNHAFKGQAAASLRVRYEGHDEFEYLISVQVSPEGAFPYAEVVTHAPEIRRAPDTGRWRERPQNPSVTDISKEEVIQHVVAAYQDRSTS